MISILRKLLLSIRREPITSAPVVKVERLAVIAQSTMPGGNYFVTQDTLTARLHPDGRVGLSVDDKKTEVILLQEQFRQLAAAMTWTPADRMALYRAERDKLTDRVADLERQIAKLETEE